jgi:hypothetical protein
MEIETYFIVSINKDGTFSTGTSVPEAEAARPATTLDIYNVSKQIVQEVESSLLTERIVSAMANVFASSKVDSVPDKVKDKLKERGIDPESITPTE